MTTQATQAQARVMAEAAGQVVADVWRQYQSGGLTEDEMVDQAEIVLSAMRMQASAYADVSLAEVLGRDPVGLDSGDESVRLVKAVRTVLADAAADPGYDVETHLRRLGWAETLSAVQDGTSDALQQQGVPGWQRVASDTACEQCTNLAAKQYLPSRVRMFHHPGCSCLQNPIVDGGEP